MTALLVMAGGALGASARYLLDHKIQGLHTRDWPWGTLTINLIGSFALGLVAGQTSQAATALISVGLIGAFTTWSTFIVETARLSAKDGWANAASYLVVSLAGGIAFAWLGSLLN